MDKVKLFLIVCVTVFFSTTVYFATNPIEDRRSLISPMVNILPQKVTLGLHLDLPETFNIGIIITDSMVLKDSLRSSIFEHLNSWVSKQLLAFISDKKAKATFYWPTEQSDLENVQTIISTRQKSVYLAKALVCDMDIVTETSYSVQLLNCAAKQALVDGIDYLVLVDDKEFDEEHNLIWVPDAINDVYNKDADPVWIQPIRRLRMSGR